MPIDKDRRRELSEQYARTPRAMGIFQIRNVKRGRIYVGASVDLEASRNRHEFSRTMPRTPIGELLGDWQADGGDAFVFEVLDRLEPPGEGEPAKDAAASKRELDALLALWLEQLQPYGARGYNAPPR